MTDRDLVNGALRGMPYADYLQTQHWQDVRKRALKAAGYRCTVCLSPEALDVHHISYEHIADELPGDVVALCRKCHGERHDILRAVIHSEFETFLADKESARE